jgi:hypothetical protein
MDCILPVTKPHVISYLHHANFLAIAQQSIDFYHYAPNYFVQLYARNNNAEDVGPETQIDFYCIDGIYPRYPFISTSWLSYDAIHCLTKGSSISDTVCSLLALGYYVEATIDEYHIPGKPLAGKQHLLHPNLIFGYSQSKHEFRAQGFVGNWIYKKFSIPFSTFDASFTERSGCLLIRSTDASAYTNARPFDPKLVKQYLRDFIESQNTFTGSHSSDCVFGAHVYDLAFSDVLRTSPSNIDIRPWCIFVEHQSASLRLAEYLRKVRSKDTGNLTTTIVECERRFTGIRNYVLKSKITGASIDCDILLKEITSVRSAVCAVSEQLCQAL